MLVNGDQVGVAAGCFGLDGYGRGLDSASQLTDFAAVTLKTTTREARLGNSPPTVCHEQDYTVNSVGLQNPGIVKVLQEVWPRWRDKGCSVGISIWAESLSEYVYLVELLARAGVDYIELNLSCVNVSTPRWTAEEADELASASSVPVYAKIGLSQLAWPIADEDIEYARAMTRSECLDGVIMGNTVRVRSEGKLSAFYGGMSGPRLRQYHLEWVRAVSSDAEVPIVAAGGVSDLSHVSQYLEAGASGVQVGTVLLRDGKSVIK